MTALIQGLRIGFILVLASGLAHGGPESQPGPLAVAASIEADALVVSIPPLLPNGGMGSTEARSTLVCVVGAREQLLIATLDEPMPEGTWLEVSLEGPGLGSGFRPMTPRGHTLSLLIPRPIPQTLTLRYRFGHHPSAAPSSFSRSLIFTLLDP